MQNVHEDPWRDVHSRDGMIKLDCHWVLECPIIVNIPLNNVGYALFHLNHDPIRQCLDLLFQGLLQLHIIRLAFLLRFLEPHEISVELIRHLLEDAVNFTGLGVVTRILHREERLNPLELRGIHRAHRKGG